MVVFTAAVVALLLGLQFGGSTYSWSDRRTVASLTVGGVIFVLFAAIEWWKGGNAILPGNIIRSRVVPLWFQAIYGLSARDSSYRIIPLIASCIIASMTGTTLTGKFRYYHPFMLLEAMLLAIGSGLLTTLHPTTSNKWVGNEILAGAGTGLGSPLPLLAIQDALPRSNVPIGYGVVLTAGYLASSVALAIAQAVFASRLISDIRQQLPGEDPNAITDAGATDLMSLLPSDMYEKGLHLYNTALTDCWYISVILAAFSVILVLGLKWKKMDMRDEK
ncbi:major facilitator superfamily transporter protein [Rutstroemia sp. NJR-2017a BBW]|nr:major facilitator superfamily transporter protein [Rutstroemia sp. NJR-2017a BBW]